MRLLKKAFVRLLHKVYRRSCNYSVIAVSQNSRERKVVCAECNRTERTFYVV